MYIDTTQLGNFKVGYWFSFSFQSPVNQKPTEVKALALSKQGLLYAGDDQGNLVEWEPNFKLKARFSQKIGWDKEYNLSYK